VASRTSDKISLVKYVVFALAIVFNLALVAFPNLIPARITDRVIVSTVLFSVTGLVFAFEELKLTLREHHENTQNQFGNILSRLKRTDDYMLLNDLYRSLRRIEDTGDGLFYKHARQTLVQLESRLKKAEEGELNLDNADTAAIGMELASEVQHSLDATVLWPDDPMPEAGRQKYLKCLAEAIARRHVVIQRLFIIEPGTENDAAFLTRVRQDLGSNVLVRYLHTQDWARTPEVPYPVDLGIWDGRRVWVYHPKQFTAASERFATLLKDRASLSLYQREFKANWDRGTEIAARAAAGS
jgi:hypothetical protein